MSLHELVLASDLAAARQYFEQSPTEAAAQINTPDADGFAPLALALRAAPANLDLIQLLIDHGADTRHRYVHSLASTFQNNAAMQLIQKHNEATSTNLAPTPEIVVLSQQQKFGEVAQLLRDGASDAPLGWTPLMRAVATGTLADVEAALSAAPSFDASDHADRNAWLLAIETGDLAKTQLLRERGAAAAKPPLNSYAPLSLAVMRGDAAMVKWLLDVGEPVDSVDASLAFAASPLIHAVRADNLSMVQLLLAAGANPDFVPPGYFQPPLPAACSRAVALALHAAGADIQFAASSVHRLLLGLSENTNESTLGLSEAEFRAGLSPRFGESNPHEFSAPYYTRMIQTGKTAYHALREFRALPDIDMTGFRYPVWSAARVGQSITFLPDGRVIQIAGEHEDFYDSNFCIYNDVFVHQPDGRIQVFGYPLEVFPPTDFHSATLIDAHIYVIGNLGHRDAEVPERTPVYRLNTTTYKLEAVETSGQSPRRLYKHRADLRANNVIRISGGTCNDCVFDFDTNTHGWTLVSGHIETDPLKIKLDLAEMNQRVKRAEKLVDDYWEGREPGGENEANDPQHKLAPEFFALYQAQHRLGGAYHPAIETAFDMWSNLEGGSAPIDEHLPKIIPGDQTPRMILNSVWSAYERDGRVAEFGACFDKLLSMLTTNEFKLYLLCDELRNSVYREDEARIRMLCEQIFALDRDGYATKQARTALQQLDALNIGKPAPDFARTDLDGNPISLAALRGRVVLIDFWATWCGPCIGELPHLKRVAKAFADKPFTLLSISLDDDVEAAKRMIKQKDMAWSHVLEGGWGENELPALYGVMGIPQLFLIDQQGRISARSLRGHDIDAAVAALFSSEHQV
jgi:thiol-disulfide isomerase/thioredoxin/ankyrin repeat protein